LTAGRRELQDPLVHGAVPMPRKHVLAAIASVVLAASFGAARAQAAVSVAYRIEAAPFKGIAAGDPLTFTLFSDAACTAQQGQVVLPAGDPAIQVEKLKLVGVKGALKPGRTLRLEAALDVVVASPFFLEITGGGIVGAGASCQAQRSGGAQGPAGEPGAPGADAATLWAVVRADGSLARGSSGSSSERYGTGLFGVTFDRDVSGCAYVASGGAASAGPPPARMVDVAPRLGVVSGVYVRIDDAAGLADSDFYLAVFCP
jgi:hypothetical protein